MKPFKKIENRRFYTYGGQLEILLYIFRLNVKMEGNVFTMLSKWSADASDVKGCLSSIFVVLYTILYMYHCMLHTSLMASYNMKL